VLSMRRGVEEEENETTVKRRGEREGGGGRETSNTLICSRGFVYASYLAESQTFILREQGFERS